MSGNARRILKSVLFAFATLAVSPSLVVFSIKAIFLGRDRALEGSTQALSLLPGLVGQYLRRAFLVRALAACHRSALIEFGTLFSQADAVIEENAYVGPRCHLGLVHIERDVLIGAGVHVTSGAHTHGSTDIRTPIREQVGKRQLVRIGAGAWIGSGAVVMADVGTGTIVGAGSIVTRALPSNVIAAGAPARVIRDRDCVDTPVL